MPLEPSNSKIHLFENIALAFSGGGFRAAAFCLGVLSYLHQFQWNKRSLLDRVKGLSTVSGGTIAGAAFALSDAKGQDFHLFFKQLCDFLSGDTVLNAALEKMEDDAVWRSTDKKHSLINAFALTYKELLTNEKMEVLFAEQGKKGHLENICFNATEFSFGLAFRFQNEGKFGNYRLQVPKQSMQEVLLADAIASSSCFPMGFAPLIMPDDYFPHDSTAYKDLKLKDFFKEGVGIMDGGIVDNQGIGSTMLADNRRGENGYDLVLVCDVASYMMKPWEQDQITGESSDTIGNLVERIVRLVRATWPMIAAFGLGIGSLLLSILSVFPKLSSIFYVVGGMGLTLGILLLFVNRISFNGLRWIKSKIEKLMPRFFLEKINYFDQLKMALIRRMIEERATSGMKMVNEVFLKQIRRLNYDLFYKDSSLDNRRATTLIYELTRSQFVDGASTEIKPGKKIPGIKDPSEKIFQAAQMASEMETTLWFTPDDTKKERLKNLLACGQFTVCYSLIRYLKDLPSEATTSSQKEIEELIEKMANDWDKFVDDPYWLIPDLDSLKSR